jgi:hypothetical protein
MENRGSQPQMLNLRIDLFRRITSSRPVPSVPQVYLVKQTLLTPVRPLAIARRRWMVAVTHIDTRNSCFVRKGGKEYCLLYVAYCDTLSLTVWLVLVLKSWKHTRCTWISVGFHCASSTVTARKCRLVRSRPPGPVSSRATMAP